MTHCCALSCPLAAPPTSLVCIINSPHSHGSQIHHTLSLHSTFFGLCHFTGVGEDSVCFNEASSSATTAAISGKDLFVVWRWDGSGVSQAVPSVRNALIFAVAGLLCPFGSICLCPYLFFPPAGNVLCQTSTLLWEQPRLPLTAWSTLSYFSLIEISSLSASAFSLPWSDGQRPLSWTLLGLSRLSIGPNSYPMWEKMKCTVLCANDSNLPMRSVEESKAESSPSLISG